MSYKSIKLLYNSTVQPWGEKGIDRGGWELIEDIVDEIRIKLDIKGLIEFEEAGKGILGMGLPEFP